MCLFKDVANDDPFNTQTIICSDNMLKESKQRQKDYKKVLGPKKNCDNRAKDDLGLGTDRLCHMRREMSTEYLRML